MTGGGLPGPPRGIVSIIRRRELLGYCDAALPLIYSADNSGGTIAE
jgi:hypothetical protein